MTAEPSVPASDGVPLSLRLLLGTLGVLAGLYGVYALVSRYPLGQLWPVARWFVLGIVLHDAVLAPLEVVLGWLALRHAAPRTRAVGRAALIGGFCVLLITGALVGARGVRQNSTVLAADPLVGLVVGLVALALAVGVLLVLGRRVPRRRAT
ncbi:hypothetical protein [uncultured Friedmanniella sp.]|uniref:hypothetical protein n=1 Tax=uncultured Friedmanniella sp. TaxID=335381 RepID=UPI0035CC1659